MELAKNERVVFEKNNVVYYKSKYQAFPGQLIMTNKKLVYIQNKLNIVGGLLGSILASSSKRTKRGELFSDSLDTLTLTKGEAVRGKNFKIKVSSIDSGKNIELLCDEELLNKIQSTIESAS